jgi:uncharacterized membrane protein YphA (DoxX/SURF4 family)
VKRGLRVLSYALLTLPAAWVVTFLLSPFWGWIESRFGIESLGHSGPSDWCFLAVYGLFLLAGAGIFALRWRVGN